MLNMSDVIILSKQINRMSKELKSISRELEAMIVAFEYNTDFLEKNGIVQEDGSLLLTNDEEVENLIKNYGSRK